MGISASMSMTLDMLAGMASYVGRSTTGAAAVGAGSEAAIAAAIEVAIVVGIKVWCWTKVRSYHFRPDAVSPKHRDILRSLLDICIMSLPPDIFASEHHWIPSFPLYCPRRPSSAVYEGVHSSSSLPAPPIEHSRTGSESKS